MAATLISHFGNLKLIANRCLVKHSAAIEPKPPDVYTNIITTPINFK